MITLKVQSTALPKHGQSMIRFPLFPRLLFPAKWCTRKAVGEAIRTGRVK